MARIIILDAGVIGLLCSSPRTASGVARLRACRAWYDALDDDVAIPDVADFEVRRELVRLDAHARLARLDDLYYGSAVEVSRDAWAKAAEFWAVVRKAGIPTASPDALDADAILAGVAITIGAAGEEVVIATTNVRHLARFPGVDAREWSTIA